MTNAVFGFLAPFLVLGNTGRFFQKNPQIFRLGLDQAGYHALFNDGIAARPQPGTQKNIGNIPAPAAGAILKILRLTITCDDPLDGNFAVLRILAAQAGVTIVKHQFDRGLSHRFSGTGAVEYDVSH